MGVEAKDFPSEPVMALPELIAMDTCIK